MTTARALDLPKPGASPGNRSLERGVEVLRAFRPGFESLANAEIAERTGLPRATVTRLAQTLVGTGLLQRDEATQAYRLAPAVLGLAHAMRTGSKLLGVAAPIMEALARRERINVGLATADRDEMLYLESIRYSRRVAWRNVVSGQRVPMELTSLGRAHLATCSEARRRSLFALFRRRRGKQWPALEAEIRRAIRSVERHGFCAASWQPEVVAIAAPLVVPQGVFALNLSVSSAGSVAEVVDRLAEPLALLRQAVEDALTS